MSAYAVLLIAALIVVSGVIAYVGDVVGRRLGRRRLTLFHLRPRHTAVAISVFAGMLIAAFTLISAMVVSQNVRDAFLHVEAMRRANARLARTALGLERTRRRLEQRVQALRAGAARMEQSLDTAKRDLARNGHELVATRQQRRQAERELQQRVAEVEQQRQALQAATARLTAVEGELEARGRELASTRATLASTNADLDRARKQLSDTQAQFADAEVQIANATRIVSQLTGQVGDLSRQREELQAQIQELTQSSSVALQTLGEIRSQPLIFGSNEEILTVVLQGARPAAEVRKDLERMVARANEVAIKAGAGALDNGRAIAFFSLAPTEGSDQPIYYSEDQVLDALAAAISAAQGSVIVRTASVRNVVKGETVLVHFELFHNQLVFRKGQELAQMVADGSQDEASLMLDLVSFLRARVSARARAAGVMARSAAHLESAEALFAGPSEVVGEIRYPDLLQVIRDIKNRKGPVRVVARAAADTWTAGPLQVKLEVAGRA